MDDATVSRAEYLTLPEDDRMRARVLSLGRSARARRVVGEPAATPRGPSTPAAVDLISTWSPGAGSSAASTDAAAIFAVHDRPVVLDADLGPVFGVTPADLDAAVLAMIGPHPEREVFFRVEGAELSALRVFATVPETSPAADADRWRSRLSACWAQDAVLFAFTDLGVVGLPAILGRPDALPTALDLARWMRAASLARARSRDGD